MNYKKFLASILLLLGGNNLLISLNGYPKSELSEIPEIEQIFGRIDSMPMRQQEMSQNSDPCQG